MDRSKLEYLSYKELKEIAVQMEIPLRRSKDDLIDDILAEFIEYEKYKRDKIEKYTKHERLGKPGKEGITYRVTTKNGKEYAMKTFKKTKSSDRLQREAELQKMAADLDIAPQVIDVDTVSKYIVMEQMDGHLWDIVKKQDGLSIAQQKQILHLYKKLDKAGVFHGDINPLNFMLKGKRLFVIDYGKARHITSGLVKKLGTNTPNQSLMTLGLVLKLKDMGLGKESYEHFEEFLQQEQKYG